MSIREAILRIVQPLGRIVYEKTVGDNVKGTDLLPAGTKDNFTQGGQYGIASKTPKGVFGYFLNFLGKHDAPIVIAQIDGVKPEVTKDGQIIFYVRKPDGKSFPVTIDLDPDGDLTITTTSKTTIQSPEVIINGANKVNVSTKELNITADTKAVITCDNVEIGKNTVEKIINGETFLTFFNAHKHLDTFSIPTTGPTIPMSAGDHLSTQVKAGK